MLQDMVDRMIIAELFAAREQLVSDGRKDLKLADLASAACQSNIVIALGAVARQRAWDQLGLDRTMECNGPQYKYH
jgi:hypothetical protein